MKALPWMIAAAGIGTAAYILANQPGLEYATGNDSIESGARKTSAWGSKNRIKGAGTHIVGKIKSGIGAATGNTRLSNSGLGDKVAGSVKDAAGSVAQAAGQTLHDLNR